MEHAAAGVSASGIRCNFAPTDSSSCNLACSSYCSPIVQTDHGGSIRVEAVQWLDSRCLRSGTFAAAVVLETDIVVVKLE
eukprot:4012895-Pleurochrysis_carterae.AAC.1